MVDKLSTPLKKNVMQLKEEDINSVVKEVVENSGLNSMERITLVEDYRSTLFPITDRITIFYIIKNLIINAIEAMREGGILTIITDNTNKMSFEMSATFEIPKKKMVNSNIYILVKDTGVGMDNKFITEKLFKPFISTKDKGIGIGLYQSRVNLEKMGGSIYCTSNKGKGTAFCVLL